MKQADKIVESDVLGQMCGDFLGRSEVPQDAIELCLTLLRNMDKGDTCLELAEGQAAVVKQCPVVWDCNSRGLPEEKEENPKKGLFILDGNKLFSRRYWNYEQAIRTKLKKMAEKNGETKNAVIPDEPVFSQLHDCQKEAVKMMVENRFSILTGGPGTGKTYTIARAVKLALQNTPSLKLGLAAPTGKAAARVNETMEQELRTLGLDEKQMDMGKAVTLHSLLQPTYTLVNFKHNKGKRLDLDWIIIDESSMVDLPLMAKLLDAIPDTCRLTLVGDEHQLASVEAGRVFGDLCRLHEEFPKCELTQSSRFPEDGTIDRFAKAVNAGQKETVLDILEKENDLIQFTEFSGPEQTSPRCWPGFEDRLLGLFSDFAKQTEPAEALKQLNQCRILCATREGLYGIGNINRYLTRLLSERYPSCPIPVMITKNDNELGVSNGDVGVMMQKDDRLYLPASGEQAVRSIPMQLLQATETAFASTIHKAQGSEYTNVVLVLPSDISLQKSPQSTQLLTRELLYTAITRTKNKIFLYTGKQAILKCCLTMVNRKTGLAIRD